MGQAKQRGTFEQRKAAAIERNKFLIISAIPNASEKVQRYARRIGTQRLATMLIAQGIMAHAQSNKGKP